MARYAIYDNASTVITPVGEELTAEMWLNRYPWGRKTKMVVGGGIINGSVAFVYDDFVAEMRRRGCDFAGCTTEQEHLDAIEKFEDTPPVETVSDQTRIADALEDMVVLNMPDAATSPASDADSATTDMRRIRWETGRITDAMLKIYVRKGVISATQYTEITGNAYTA